MTALPHALDALGAALEAATDRRNFIELVSAPAASIARPVRERRRRRRALIAVVAAAAVVGIPVAASAQVRGAIGDFFDSSGPPVGHMKVFHIPPPHVTEQPSGYTTAPTGPIPADIDAQLRSMVDDEPASDPENMKNGTVAPRSAGRVLLVSHGRVEAAAYGIPTSKGRVCYIGTGLFQTGGCVTGFGPDAPILETAQPADGPNQEWVIDGLAADEVAKIEVLSTKSHTPAILQHNAFIWMGVSQADLPTGFLITYTSGRTQKLPAPAMTDEDIAASKCSCPAKFNFVQAVDDQGNVIPGQMRRIAP